MKKILILGLAILCMATFAQAKTYRVKLSHDLSEDTPQHEGALMFKKIVEEKTDGKVKIQIFPSGQLGHDVETVELMQMGSIQASLVPTAKLSGFSSAMQICDLPFLFSSREATYYVLDSEVGMDLMGELRKIGLEGVAFWESGFKQLTANKPISTPEDYKGLKIRVMESPILIEQFKAMDANATPIAFAETYNALQQGVVDGQENPLVSIVRMRFYEVQKYLTVSNHGYLAYAFLFSKDFFDGLPAEYQKVIREAAIEAAKFERDLTVKMEEGFLKTIRESGTTVVVLNDEQRAAFVKATRPVHDKFADKVGRELLEAVYAKDKEFQNKK